MKKLPVAGPTYDYKLENIRNDIIEQELALCLKKRENVYLDEDVQVKYTDASGTEYTFGQVTEDTVSLQTDVTTLQSDFTTLDGEVTANATAVSGLETRVTSAEGTITANSTSITSLQSDLTTAEGNITANATAASSLDTRVTTAEGNITSQASDITTLQSDLSALDTDVTANATAVSSLSTQVSTIDGEVTALSSDVTNLTTTVGTNTTNITTNASSINGIEGKYAVKINNNGHVSGFGLISTANNATPTSTFTVTADAFKIVDTSGAATPAAPFEVYTSARVVDGVTVPAGVYMENANITAANIKTLDVDVINLDGVTLDTSGGQLIVKPLGIDTAQLADDSVSTVERQEASSQTQTANGAFNDIATVTISADTDDKFAVLARVQFFTFTGWTSTNVITLAINFGNQSYSDTISLIQASNNSYMHGFTFGGIFSANTSGSQNVTLTVAGGPVGGTGTMTVYGGAISVQRLVK